MEKSFSYFSSNLKWWRKSHKYSQTKLAEYLKKKTSIISAYENGVSKPSIGILAHLSALIGVSVDDLLYKDLSLGQDFDVAIEGNLKSNQKVTEITFKKENETNYKDIFTNEFFIEQNLFRIEEVKKLILVLVEKYNFTKDEATIFRSYNKKIEWLKINDMHFEYSTKRNRDKLFLEDYSLKSNELLLSVYEDLFNIVNAFNVLMVK